MTTRRSFGLVLARRFYRHAVRPIVHALAPRLRYAAALIGPGSEVLGFDDEMSRDHHWGPRLLLLLNATDHRRLGGRLHRVLTEQLPSTFDGYSTHFGPADEIGVRMPARALQGRPIAHMVDIHDLRTWAAGHLGFDPMRPIAARTWLKASEQALLEFTAGEVFHDDDGRLTRLRNRLTCFPRDVQLVKLAQSWQAISDEEAFVGRTGMRNDEIGSRLIAGRQVERLTTIAFLLEQRYKPYSKWLGTAFSRLKIAPRLGPHLHTALTTADWRERERRLALAAGILADLQARRRLSPRQSTRLRRFHDRGFIVLDAQRFAAALRMQIRSPALRRIADNGPSQP